MRGQGVIVTVLPDDAQLFVSLLERHVGQRCGDPAHAFDRGLMVAVAEANPSQPDAGPDL